MAWLTNRYNKTIPKSYLFKQEEDNAIEEAANLFDKFRVPDKNIIKLKELTERLQNNHIP